MRDVCNSGTLFVVGVATAIAVLIPQIVNLYLVIVYSNLAIMALFALSLAWVWGYGGILCFGQSAFFGLAAYVYAVSVINIGESTAPFLLAVLVPTVFAAVIGALMFYGRVSDIYFAIITLCVTLILYSLISSTAGPQFHIFAARLNGQNGISGFRPLNLPGRSDDVLGPVESFYVCMTFLIGCYVALKFLLSSRFGRVVVAVRENPVRAELLGYDTRWTRTFVFTIGAAIAGLAGALFAVWGTYVNPSLFDLRMAALVIIWVVVGGLGTLAGPMVGAVALQYLGNVLGKQQLANTGMIYGFLLIVFVMLVPQGVFPTMQRLISRWSLRRSQYEMKLLGDDISKGMQGR